MAKEGEVSICACYLEIDEEIGKAKKIETIYEKEKI